MPEREFPHPGHGRAVRLFSRTRYDRVGQILETEREIRINGPEGAPAEAHFFQSFRLRWIYKAEMELLLGAAGFTRWAVAGGFDGQPLASDRDEMVWSAWSEGR